MREKQVEEGRYRAQPLKIDVMTVQQEVDSRAHTQRMKHQGKTVQQQLSRIETTLALLFSVQTLAVPSNT